MMSLIIGYYQIECMISHTNSGESNLFSVPIDISVVLSTGYQELLKAKPGDMLIYF